MKVGFLKTILNTCSSGIKYHICSTLLSLHTKVRPPAQPHRLTSRPAWGRVHPHTHVAQKHMPSLGFSAGVSPPPPLPGPVLEFSSLTNFGLLFAHVDPAFAFKRVSISVTSPGCYALLFSGRRGVCFPRGCSCHNAGF